MTVEEEARWQTYFELSRQHEEDRARVARIVARQKLTEALLDAGVRLYIAQITAPWQALANHIRSELPT